MILMNRPGYFTRLALAFALASSVAAVARALDETEAMHARARAGETPTDRDREHARRLLEEWIESEREAAAAPGDQSLGRALKAVAAGRAPVAAETAALERWQDTGREDRLAAPGDPGRPGPGAPRGVVARGTAWRARRRARWMLAVGATGLLVLGAVVAFVVWRNHSRRGAGELRR